MAQKTINYNLHKIDLTDAPPDITVLNPNFDIIDTELKKNAEQLAKKETPEGAQAKATAAKDAAIAESNKALNLTQKHKLTNDNGTLERVTVDLNTLKGATRFVYANSGCKNKPVGFTEGLLEVFRLVDATDRTIQRATDAITYRTYVRVGVNTTWSEWRDTSDADTVDGKHASDFALSNHNHDNTYVGLGANVPMLSSKDLNTCTTGGRWFAINCTNRPSSADHGLLEVYRYDGANFNPTGQGATPVTFQRFTHYSTGAIYSRTLRYTNTWTTWERVGVVNRTYQIETISSHSTKTFTYAKGGVCKITFPENYSPYRIYLAIDGVVKMNKLGAECVMQTHYSSFVGPIAFEIPFNSKFTIEYWHTNGNRQDVTVTYQYYLNN